MSADFHLANHGSILILTPVSEAGLEWADEHLPTDALTWGRNGIVVEPRYIEPIIAGILADGLDVQ